ncbi:MAG: glycosyltransferase family 9 protein [Alphaproteobacteria bacterium]|nr:glycosyltransferase family 9 protein [Alphaproteobacteria bacterium]
MRILFISATRLGDAVLSTGLLAHIARRHPNSRVTVACGALPAPLFEACPNREETIVLKKQRFHRHWFKLWRTVVGTRWDMVVDLRDSAVSRTVRARERFIYTKRIDRKNHKVAQLARVMKLDDVPAPTLWFTAQQIEQAALFCPKNESSRILGIGPTANWIGKTWPAERFVELVRRLTAPEGIFPGAPVAVFAAPGEEAPARLVLESVPADRRIDVIAKADPGTVAAVLARCAFYVGNDSGLMHTAAAAGVPTLGLFGPTDDREYGPWGDHCAVVRTPESREELTGFPGYEPKTLDRSLMESLTVEAVLEAASRLSIRSAP